MRPQKQSSGTTGVRAAWLPGGYAPILARMTAFVAGATGYTGREIVRELAQRNCAVIAHVRPDSPHLNDWQERFRRLGATVAVTAWQLAALESALVQHNPTHIFALLGTTRARVRAAARAGRLESYQRVDYELTSMLINAARTCAPAARFIYLSSVGVSSSARSAYLSVRWRVESELKASGLRYTIARPAFITGTDRDEPRLGERLGARLSDAVLNALAAAGIKSLRARFGSLTGRQLAHALVGAALDTGCIDMILEADRLRQFASR